MPIALPTYEHSVILALAASEGEVAFEDLAKETGLDQSLVSAAVAGLLERGWVEVGEVTLTEPALTEAGELAAAEGTPERQLLLVLDLDDHVLMPDVHKVSAEKGFDGSAAVQWIFRKKWAKKMKSENGDGPDRLVITAEGENALITELSPDEVAIARTARGEITYLEDLAEDGIDVEELVKVLRSRKDLIRLKPRTRRRAGLTAAGREAVAEGVKAAEEVTALTPELLASGRWSEVTFKKFDVTLPAEKLCPGRAHPIFRIVQDTREAFFSMGFEEVRSDFVESGFWDFDALFQPQDHPAREMQDTFYLERPGKLPLPDDEAMIERVRRTHEDGGDTGSTGWGYKWSIEKARQAILRTHCTATSIRSLFTDPNPPRKVFTIGKVFRRETVSYKHLPEFNQIDGIIIDEGATLATLKGTLTEYYRKLGFDRIKFKPSFFPYTEPSAEIYVWMESRQQWVEMGGSGIFRPEVTEPLGCKVPVLAWGLGLERLALFRFGASHLRELYDGDLDWLREVPLCL
jgi:phenylalanyl-tRNA synthetase alpha chain